MSVKMIQRSKGRSATAAIAYRAGIDITDERTGLRFDYSRKTGVSYSEIVLPHGAPEQYRDRCTLWNTIESRETRTNAAVAREFEIALPAQLPRKVREQLARDFARYIVDRFGIAADVNLHDPHPRDGDDTEASNNYHAHILTSTRRLTPEGFTDKCRELDSAKTGSAIVDEIREHFAQMVNDAYAAHQVAMFVDHRSHERRGIDRTPTIHIGVNHNGDRAEQNAAIIAANAHMAAIAAEAAAIQQQIDTLLYEATPIGETVPLFALEPATADPTLPLETAPATVEVAPQWEQLPLDFDAPTIAPAPVADEPTPSPALTPVVSIDKHRRYRELEALKDKASTYGRAHAAMIEQRGNAAAFERELAALEKPGVLHRFVNSRRWQRYESDKASLEHRIHDATTKASRLQTIATQHRQYQTQWDREGWAEHKALAHELGIGPYQKGASGPVHGSPAPQISLSTDPPDPLYTKSGISGP